MATITQPRIKEASFTPKLLVWEPEVTSELQSPEGRQLAQVAEKALLVLQKCQEYLEYLENTCETDYNSVPPKRSERLVMRAQFKGRRKPLPYPLDEE